MELTMEQSVYIVLLNWNGWQDTIECLESIGKLDYSRYKVIVCDNQSSDHSVEHIKAWANGQLQCHCSSTSPEIQERVLPCIKKPIAYRELAVEDIETIGQEDANCKLILLHTGGNLGFAGGCNVGIRYALHQQDCGYIWLLNNDTVVDTKALRMLVEYNKVHTTSICGSKLLYYYDPSRIQALGNSLNRFLGTTHFITDKNNINAIDFLVGASMFMPKDVFIKKGLLSEDYFLYYEEADFWQQCKDEYRFVCVEESVVYHKEGASTGASDKKIYTKSIIGDFYGIKNRILFMKKYFPQYMISVYLGLIMTMINRIRRKQFNRVVMVLKLMVNCNANYTDVFKEKRDIK